jgi:hypothetical protein
VNPNRRGGGRADRRCQGRACRCRSHLACCKEGGDQKQSRTGERLAWACCGVSRRRQARRLARLRIARRTDQAGLGAAGYRWIVASAYEVTGWNPKRPEAATKGGLGVEMTPQLSWLRGAKRRASVHSNPVLRDLEEFAALEGRLVRHDAADRHV